MALRRGVTPELLAAVSQPYFFPVVLVYLDWPDAPVYAHSGVGVLEYGGEDWIGVGPFGSIQLPEEAAGMASLFGELELVGLPDELDNYLDDAIRGRAARVYFGAVTERAGNVLVGDPVEVFAGAMDALKDTVSMEDGNLRRGVRLRASMGPSQREFAAAFHTPEDQSRAFPGDTAGRLVLFAEAEAGKLEW